MVVAAAARAARGGRRGHRLPRDARSLELRRPAAGRARSTSSPLAAPWPGTSLFLMIILLTGIGVDRQHAVPPVMRRALCLAALALALPSLAPADPPQSGSSTSTCRRARRRAVRLSALRRQLRLVPRRRTGAASTPLAPGAAGQQARTAADGRRRARGGLLPPHRLHAARRTATSSRGAAACSSPTARSARSSPTSRRSGTGPPIPTPHPERGSLSDGLQLFTEHCAGCHQIVAEGGYVTGGVAPPLDGRDAAQIAEAVRIGPYLMPRFSEKQTQRPRSSTRSSATSSTRSIPTTAAAGRSATSARSRRASSRGSSRWSRSSRSAS